MTKHVALVCAVLLMAVSVAAGAAEIGVRFTIGYNPNATTAFRAVQLPLNFAVAVYGEIQGDRWTGSASVGSSLVKWAPGLAVRGSYAVTSQVSARASLSLAATAGDFVFFAVNFGGAVAVSEQPVHLSIGSMPVGVGVLHFQGRTTPTVTLAPALFVEADWNTDSQMHFRERIDLGLIPVSSDLIEQNLPPDRMWEAAALMVSSTTSVGWTVR